MVTRLAGGGSAGGVASGSTDGTGSAARFNYPYGVAVSSSGSVYVAATLNQVIRMISPTGSARLLRSAWRHMSLLSGLQGYCVVGVVTRLAGGGSASGVATGSADGTGSAAMFKNPNGVAVSSSGSVYVADSSNHLIRMISPTGTACLLYTSPSPRD